MRRDEAVRLLRDATGGRPVYWLDERTVCGDFDGCERAIDVFDVEPGEARALFHRLSGLRGQLEELAGGPVTLITHAPAETTRLYPWVRPATSQRDEPMVARDPHGARPSGSKPGGSK